MLKYILLDRKILHLDLDAFFCAVEENDDPSLRGKPFAVGGLPNERGVVASCSYAARLFGIHSAMPMARAIKLCPELIIISSRHHSYSEVSKQVMDYLHTITPLLEQISIDEAFLDLSDLPESSEELAHTIQNYIRDNFGLPCSIGVATNKLVAKIATNVGKASLRTDKPPCAIKVIPPGMEANFLSPLPTTALWGIGPKTGARLDELGIHTIGDITRWSKNDLIKRFGKFGTELSVRAQGIDESPIITSHEVKSISQETTFAQDVKDMQILRETLHHLSEKVGRSARKENLAGSTVRLKLRWYDFTTITRQVSLSHPSNDDEVIFNTSLKLLKKVWQADKPVRLLGVGITKFGKSVEQLSLWDTAKKKDGHLLAAVDTLREKYGDHAILRGSELKRVSPKEEKSEKS